MTFKNSLAGTIGLLLFVSASAGAPKSPPFHAQPSFSDSTAIKDSLKQASRVNDPKQEFRQALAASTLPLGITVEELNPQMISFVEDYTKKFGKKMGEVKDKSQAYLAIMDGILEQYDIPKELKYLAVIESYLQTNARSYAGAVGPWQFMPVTARTMGLKVTKKYDERRDFSKSTHAACKYLTGLYAMYNDWLLVIAAYNGGPGKVDGAIKKSGSRDFWTLQKYLPVESKNHVKKFIATHYLMEGRGSIATITKEEAKNLAMPDSTGTKKEIAGSKTQSISGRYLSFVIMKHISMDIVSFNKLNPSFDKQIGSAGIYELRLPAEKMDLFLAKKSDILNESLQSLLKPANTKVETSKL